MILFMKLSGKLSETGKASITMSLIWNWMTTSDSGGQEKILKQIVKNNVGNVSLNIRRKKRGLKNISIVDAYVAGES